LTENEDHENDGPSELQHMKLHYMKMTDQCAGHEIAVHYQNCCERNYCIIIYLVVVGVMISNGNLLCGMSGQCERVPQLG